MEHRILGYWRTWDGMGSLMGQPIMVLVVHPNVGLVGHPNKHTQIEFHLKKETKRSPFSLTWFSQ